MDYYQAILYRHEKGSSTASATTTPGNSMDAESHFYSINEADSSSSQPVLRFAIANGLQTLQRAFSSLGIAADSENDGGRKRSPASHLATNASNLNGGARAQFDYVEAMACPSGCVNGGGQLRFGSINDETPEKSQVYSSRETPTETRRRVASTRDWLQWTTSNGAGPRSLASEGSVTMEIDDNNNSRNGGLHQQASDRCRTRYHVVPPMTYSIGAATGVKVEDVQW